MVFSVEYPGPDYVGTEGSQPGFLIASLAGVNDQRFGGLLNFLVNGDGDEVRGVRYRRPYGTPRPSSRSRWNS